MISLELARQLHEAGLTWQPAERDLFALPGRDMDEQIFVVSPLPALVQRVNGYPVVAFQASAEWALDYVMLVDALWLPSEAQLREQIAARLEAGSPLRLERTVSGYRCTVSLAGAPRAFEGVSASNAYGQALLALLVHEASAA